MSDLYDAGESRLSAAHRYLTETDPLYRISLVVAPLALFIAVASSVGCLAWPSNPHLPPPAVPVPAPQPAANPADQPDALRAQAVRDPKALAELRKLADGGNAEAEFCMATLYDPTLTELPFANKDLATSLDWYRKAAEQGHAVAEQTLGQAYLEGWGVAKDDTQAALWFRKAAQQGLPHAARFIGLLTAFGQGVEKDCAVAKNWLMDAKAGGDPDAANYLASGAGGCKW